MTTRPESLRKEHQRNKRRSLLAGMAAATWILCGVALVVITGAWWAYSFIGVGAAASIAFFVVFPRSRRARKDLARVEELRDEQARAKIAQKAARMRAFSQPPVRAPFASR